MKFQLLKLLELQKKEFTKITNIKVKLKIIDLPNNKTYILSYQTLL